MRPVPGYASCSRSAWPPIRFLGYRRFFGLRASIAVSSVAYRPYRVCVTVIQDRSVYRLPVHFQLLSTPPRGDAVTFSFLAGSSAREGLAPSCARLFSSARPQPSGCFSVRTTLVSKSFSVFDDKGVLERPTRRRISNAPRLRTLMQPEGCGPSEFSHRLYRPTPHTLPVAVPVQ